MDFLTLLFFVFSKLPLIVTVLQNYTVLYLTVCCTVRALYVSVVQS